MPGPRRLLSIAIVFASLAVALAADAQDSIDDARQRRAEIQEEAALKAAELDLLEARDEEIVAALEQIEAWIGMQEAALAAAEQQLAIAEENERDAEAEIAGIDEVVGSLRAQLTAQSVDTYIGGFRPPAVFDVADINTVPMLDFALAEAGGRMADAADLLRVAAARQEALRVEARDAADQASGLRAEIQTKIADLDASRAEQQTIKAEISNRIALLEAEAEALAAEDDDIASFIRSEQARIAEEQRLAAEAAEAAAAERARQAAADEARRAAEEEARRVAEERAAATPTPAAAPTAVATTPPGQPTATPAPQPTVAPQPTPVPAPRGTVRLQWPLGAGFSSGFGNRVHPVYGTVRFHSGLDLNGSHGTPIGAAGAGTVIFAGWYSGYGNTVLIDHGSGISTLYGHMSGFAVSAAQSVSAGATIGYVGSTGVSTGPHCHFEVRLNGSVVDPLGYLP